MVSRVVLLVVGIRAMKVVFLQWFTVWWFFDLCLNKTAEKVPDEFL